MDEQEDAGESSDQVTREVVENKLREARERTARYEAYQKLREETGVSQLSLTDADAKLMKSKNGFVVAYNPQTAVDSETHLIKDFEMTNQVTDHGLLYPAMEEIRKDTSGEILETAADKGYENKQDMIKCLENGIIPHVITDDGKDGYEMEIPYEEAEADLSSTKPEELSKALHTGQIPDAYKDVITKIEVKEVRRKEKEEYTESEGIKSVYGTPEEMRERAKKRIFCSRSGKKSGVLLIRRNTQAKVYQE